MTPSSVVLEHWYRGVVGERGRTTVAVKAVSKTQLTARMGGYDVKFRLKDGFPVGVGPKDRATTECFRIPEDVLLFVHGFSVC